MQLTTGSNTMIHHHQKREHKQPGVTLPARIHSIPCWTPITLGTTVGYLLHKRVPLLPGQKLTQLPVLEACSVVMSSVLQSPSELVPKSLKARNATVAKLLMSWDSMDSPVLRMQAASQGIQPSTPSSRGHWPALVPLLPWSCQLDKWQKEAGLIDFGPLVKRPKTSMGCNSCGHFCSGPPQRHCQTGWFCGYKSWGCKIPKISWPPKQLPLSTSGYGDHWWHGKSTAHFLSCLAKETCWHVWWPQGAPVAPPVKYLLFLAVLKGNAVSILACVKVWSNIICSTCPYVNV